MCPQLRTWSQALKSLNHISFVTVQCALCMMKMSEWGPAPFSDIFMMHSAHCTVTNEIWFIEHVQCLRLSPQLWTNDPSPQSKILWIQSTAYSVLTDPLHVQLAPSKVLTSIYGNFRYNWYFSGGYYCTAPPDWTPMKTWARNRWWQALSWAHRDPCSLPMSLTVLVQT